MAVACSNLGLSVSRPLLLNRVLYKAKKENTNGTLTDDDKHHLDSMSMDQVVAEIWASVGGLGKLKGSARRAGRRAARKEALSTVPDDTKAVLEQI